ncbi:LOW QUALITY PROTEIN: MICAL-like protein 1 [Drosophila gunungcola]|uniref:LOW QUALITY PROTEIN: MICAL-like protein 1 n=1 Tax=Drosophila gunungcola TaxID=103775 RepID=UPI0022E428D2|nr:LOW QUALITY PROTEIN: MICAL-like protein 1 [Drosophila gunungcola]
MTERRGTQGTKALEYWCRVITQGYNGVKIDNMTTSWRNGLAFCAIIHHFRPDLIDFDQLKPDDIYDNNDLAFTTAEKYLGIPALLDAADMVSYEVPDRLSILTYLSQFYKVLGKSLKVPKPDEPFPDESEPPQKMMHIVGMPRRDKCQKCELPVFLAERVLVGKRAYHRTCLKCARCGSLLTPGSFYETEVNNTYCCETCPDEESETETDIVELKTPSVDPAIGIKLVAESPDHLNDQKNNEDLEDNNNEASISTTEKPLISETPSVVDKQNEVEVKVVEVERTISTEQNEDEKPIRSTQSEDDDLMSSEQKEVDSPISTEQNKDLTNDPVKPDVQKKPNIPSLPLDEEDGAHLEEVTTLEKLDEPEVTSSTSELLIPELPKTPIPQINTQEDNKTEHNIKCNTENEILSKTESCSKQEDDIVKQKDLESPKETIETKVAETHYPEDLNPFKDDDEDSSKGANPFDSSDDEVELLKNIPKRDKVVPPRPPPPKIGQAISNPLEDQHSSPTPSQGKKLPMPTPRISISKPLTAAKSMTHPDQKNNFNISSSSSEHLNSSRSFDRGADDRGSSISLPSSNAPRKPLRASGATPLKSEDSSPTTSLSSITSPMRKKRQAPLPPKQVDIESEPGFSKLSDEQKALLHNQHKTQNQSDSTRRLIPLDQSLLFDETTESSSNYEDSLNTSNADEEVNIVYRRILVPPAQTENKEDQKTPIVYNDFDRNVSPLGYNKSTHGKWKRRKGPAPAVPIPPRKVLQRLPLQEIRHEFEIIAVQQLGLEKQGVILEKMIRDRCERSLDAMENTNDVTGASTNDGSESADSQMQNSKEVEDLILQLFELVNEKNELFRRQAELMYLRRQHRLEQEQADIEHEIRVLMGQPEHNKTDTDKAHEEVLINRLVKVVEMRNEVIDSLETDRVREAREDMSIKNRLHIYNSERETEPEVLKSADKSSKKLSKKERKKLKEENKLGKGKKSDLDKDVDESEPTPPASEKAKKKRNLFFLKM